MPSLFRSRPAVWRVALVASVATATLLGASAQTSAAVSNRAASGGQIATLTVAAPGSRANLYPGNESGTVNYWIDALVQEGLVHPTANGTYQPALATSWSEPNATTYVFQIRKNARFSDGTPLTAADVVASIDYAASAKYSAQTASYLADLASATQSGPYQVTVKLKAPQVSFLSELSSSAALWVSSKSFLQAHESDLGTPTSLVLGTGPYKVTKFVPDEGVWLTRDSTWWGGVPKVKNIVVTFYNDESAEYLAAKSGAVDLALWIMPTQEPSWNSLSGFHVINALQASYVGLIFDPNVKPFNELAVRKAVAEAFPRQTFVNRVLRGGDSQVATAITAPVSLRAAYSQAGATAKLASIPQNTFSLSAAKKELASSSYPHGFTTTLDWPNNGPQLGLAAAVLASNLKQIGITLKVSEVPIETWLGNMFSNKYGLNFMWDQVMTGDQSELAGFLLGAGNPSDFSNAQVNSLLNTEYAQTNPQKRAQEIIELNKLATGTDLVDAPLWWEPIGMAFKDGISISSYDFATFYSPWAAGISASS